jgi:hypothetical protein
MLSVSSMPSPLWLTLNVVALLSGNDAEAERCRVALRLARFTGFRAITIRCLPRAT